MNGPTRFKVAYIMSRFPKLTETFILYEMQALEQLGVQVEVYPLLRARKTATHQEGTGVWTKITELISRPSGTLIMHPEAVPYVERAKFVPFFSWRIFLAQLNFLLRDPFTYLGTLWTLIRENWGSLNFLLGALSLFPKTVYFARLMAADGITHVHAHFANHPAAAAYIIHRLTGIPYSFTAHGADLQVDQHMLCKKVSAAAFTVTISKFNKDLILDKCDVECPDRIKVIHCGVDTSVFAPRAEISNTGQSSHPFVILCIGTMYEVKGHTYLVEACRLLNEQGVDFVCHLVGDGPFRPALIEQVEQSGLIERVVFRGQLTRGEVAELLNEVDVLALPSIPTSNGRREGIPVVLMEAMASGVPVVASGISGIPELVENEVSGLLVQPRKPEELANALRRLSQDPVLRQRIGLAGRDKVQQEFDLNKNAALLIHSIDEARDR